MKKLVSILAVAAFMFTLSANAQEKESSKKKKAKTEKAVASEKKDCAKGEKKGAACCAHKAEAKS